MTPSACPPSLHYMHESVVFFFSFSHIFMLFSILSGIMDYGHGLPSLLSLTLLDFDLDYLSHEVRFTTIMVRKKCQKKKGKFQEFGISHLSILYYHHLYLVMTALLCRSWCFVPYMHIFCNKLYNRLWYMVSQVANIAYAGIICNEKYYNWLFF